MPRLFPHRDMRVWGEAVDGWRFLAPPDAPAPDFAIRNDVILCAADRPWQTVIGHFMVNMVMRLQPDMLFFHAAALARHGHGIMLVGEKGSGKTTLSLTLASRGWSFLGDEHAAVDAHSRELIPFRRAASIRPGAKATAVEQYLAHAAIEAEYAPDGSARQRVHVSSLFPDAVKTAGHSRASLTHLFFLRGFAPAIKIERFTPGMQHLTLLTPLLSSVWDVPPGRRAVECLNLMAKAQCFHVDAGGTPEQTAVAIEAATEQ